MSKIQFPHHYADNETIKWDPAKQQLYSITRFKKEKFMSTEGQTEFILTNYDPTRPIMVFLNGLYQEDGAE